MVKVLIQDACIRLMQTKTAQVVVRTPIGRRVFEALYLGYKERVEAPGAAQLRPLFKNDTWVVDVGANIGFFTLKFASWLRDDARVIAIEPEAINFGRLLERVKAAELSGRVIAVNAAATDREGPVRLAVRPEHPGDHKLVETGGVEVAGRTIDSIVTHCGAPNVGLLKIDVQGAEGKVLDGAREVLERDRPVILIEIDDAGLRKFGSSAEDVLGRLAGLGYRFRLLGANGLAEIEMAEVLRRVSDGSGTYLDLVAICCPWPQAATDPRQ